MTVNEVAKIMNSTKTRVKPKRVMFLRSHYLSMYRVYMIRLFDDFYVSDPTVFNTKELYKNIADLDITDMFGNSGGLNLNYEQAKFAYLKATDDTKKSFLYNLMNALKYREMCEYLDRLYEDCGFRGSPSVRIKLNVCLQGAMVLAKSGLELNQVVADCITEFEDEVKYINFNEYIWCLAMHELGIPKEEWQCDGLIDGKMSHSAEVECAKGILNGVYKVTGGKYTDVFIKWLRNHPWGENRMSIDSKGLYDYLFIDRFFEINSMIDALTDALSQDPAVSMLGVYGSRIYYKQQRTTFDVPVGLFQIVNDMSDEEQIMPAGTCIYGMTGEFYSVDRLADDGIYYVGCPMVLEAGKDVLYVYDREQTNVVFESWYSYNDAVFSFSEEESLNAPPSPFILGTLSDTLYKGYVNSLKSPDGLIFSVKVSSLSQFEQAKREVWKFIEGVRK